MTEAFFFFREWSLVLLLEALALAVVVGGFSWRGRAVHRRPTVYAHVEVFLREAGVAQMNREVPGAASPAAPAGFERAVEELGGEVLTRLSRGGPLIVRLPPGSIPGLRAHGLVERVDVSNVVAFRLGNRRS